MSKVLEQLDYNLSNEQLTEDQLASMLTLAFEELETYNKIYVDGATHLSNLSAAISKNDPDKGFLSLEDFDSSLQYYKDTIDYLKDNLSQEELITLSTEYTTDFYLFGSKATIKASNAVGSAFNIVGSSIKVLGKVAAFIIGVIEVAIRMFFRIIDIIVRIIRTFLAIIVGVINNTFALLSKLLGGNAKFSSFGIFDIWAPTGRWAMRVGSDAKEAGKRSYKGVREWFKRKKLSRETMEDNTLELPDYFYHMLDYAWPMAAKADSLGSMMQGINTHIKDIIELLNHRHKDIVKVADMTRIEPNTTYGNLDNASRTIQSNLATLDGALVKVLALSDANLFTKIISGPSSVDPKRSMLASVKFGNKINTELLPSDSVAKYSFTYKAASNETATHTYVINERTYETVGEKILESKLPNEGVLRSVMSGIKELEAKATIAIKNYTNDLEHVKKQLDKSQSLIESMANDNKAHEFKVEPKEFTNVGKIVSSYITAEANLPKLLSNELLNGLKAMKYAATIIHDCAQSAIDAQEGE